MSSNATSAVVSYLPSCSDLSTSDLSVSDAQAYQPTSWDYYKSIFPTIIPGVVFGILAALGFIFFLIWVFIQGCRRTKGEHLQEHSQFLIAADHNGHEDRFSSQLPSVHNNGVSKSRKKRFRWRNCSASLPFRLILVILALTVIGVSTWGLVESILSTNDTFSAFWRITNDVEDRARAATVDLQVIYSQLGQLQRNLTVIQGASRELAQVFSDTTIAGFNVNDGLTEISNLISELPDLRNAAESAIVLVNDTLTSAIDNFQGDVEPPTLAFENTWRFIPIAVLFGVSILCASLAGIFCYNIRWPKWTSTIIAILWLDIALLTLLGAGLMSGVNVVTEDTCLYVETYATYRAESTIQDANIRNKTLLALDYYFGVIEIPDEQVLNVITGLPAREIQTVIQGPVGSTLQLLTANGTTAQALITLGLQPTTANAIVGSAALLRPISLTLDDLASNLYVSSIQPLYWSIKEYLCCTLHNEFVNVWVAWMVVGILGYVLCILCSIRIIQHTLVRKEGGGGVPAPLPPLTNAH